MVAGIGVDLVSIERIAKVYRKYPERFLKRIFTPQEEVSLKVQGLAMTSLAARFAAKEAVLKAIGCGIGPAALNEVEVIAQPGLPPLIRLHGEASRLASEKNITDIFLSMTHEPPLACAFATAISVSPSA